MRRRVRRSSDGLPVPLQLQILEADFLDTSKSGPSGASRMVQGIEFDGLGRRQAYWLHGEHPGDAFASRFGSIESRAVPASEIAHIYEKQRAQARGVPSGRAGHPQFAGISMTMKWPSLCARRRKPASRPS